MQVLAGRDPHHIAEPEFKALGLCAALAVEIDPRVDGVPSTKGAPDDRDKFDPDEIALLLDEELRACARRIRESGRGRFGIRRCQ